MLRQFLTISPFLWLACLMEGIDHGWTTWRTYCRIRNWFPDVNDLSLSLSTSFKHRSNIRIGDHVRIGPGVIIGAHAPVLLEDYVRISQNAMLETASLDLSQPLPYPHVSQPITIRKGAWIGAGAIVLGGVTIGEKAIVGAGVVVTRDVAAGEIIVGASPRRLAGRQPALAQA